MLVIVVVTAVAVTVGCSTLLSVWACARPVVSARPGPRPGLPRCWMVAGDLIQPPAHHLYTNIIVSVGGGGWPGERWDPGS